MVKIGNGSVTMSGAANLWRFDVSQTDNHVPLPLHQTVMVVFRTQELVADSQLQTWRLLLFDRLNTCTKSSISPPVRQRKSSIFLHFLSILNTIATQGTCKNRTGMEFTTDKDTRSSLQSPLSKTKPNRTYETIVSYTAIFSDSAKPNIRNLWTFLKSM